MRLYPRPRWSIVVPMYKSFADLRTGFLVLILALFCAAVSARAQEGLFTVSDITVDVTAENALKAREQAFAQAQVDAFKALAARMMPEAEAASFAPPDISVISGMILDFEVTKEQLSATRYVGTYTFSFNESAVRSYFGARNVTYSAIKSRPVLVLPFMAAGDKTDLWSPFNLWMNAWSRANNLQSGLVPLVAPLGDLDDARDIGDNEAFRPDRGKLARMLQRYEAGEAVIAVASLDTPLAAGARDTDPAPRLLTIRLYRTDREMPELSQELSLSAAPGQAAGSLFDQGVANVKAALQSDWKAKTASKASENMRLQVKAPFTSLNQWTETKRALDRVYGIENLKVASITPQFAVLDFTFRGDESRLRMAMEQTGLVLMGGVPVFTPGGMAGSMPLPAHYEVYLRPYAPAQPPSQTYQPSPQPFYTPRQQQAPAYPQYQPQGPGGMRDDLMAPRTQFYHPVSPASPQAQSQAEPPAYRQQF